MRLNNWQIAGSYDRLYLRRLLQLLHRGQVDHLAPRRTGLTTKLTIEGLRKTGLLE